MNRGQGLVRAVVCASCRARQLGVDWIRRVWRAHQDLMDENAAYRRQVHLAVGALLSVMVLNPHLRAVATALVGIYVAAHDPGGGGGLSPGTDRWPREDW